VHELEECAKAQGVKFRRGDILILRVGFIKKYYDSLQAERDALQTRAETLSVKHYNFLSIIDAFDLIRLARASSSQRK
jgi:hypothetical protein